MKIDISAKLKSRKFWLAVLSVAVLLLQEQYSQATVVVLGYLGVQGALELKK